MGRFDFDKMKKLETWDISDETVRRDIQDVTWQLPQRGTEVEDGRQIIVVPELQSTVDIWSAIRIRRYVTEICLSKHIGDALISMRKIPPFLPVVFYTGRTEWSAAKSVEELVLPRFGLSATSDHSGLLAIGSAYLLLSAHELAQQPLPPDNVVSLLIEIETFQSHGSVASIAQKICHLLDDAESEELRRAMLSLLAQRVPEGQLRKLLENMEVVTALYAEGALLEEVERRWVSNDE